MSGSKATEAGYGESKGYGQPPPYGYNQASSTSQVPNVGYNAPPGTYVVNQQPMYGGQQQAVMVNHGTAQYVAVEQQPNYSLAIGLSFFAAFCCCPVTGLIAIIFAFIGQSSSEPNKFRSYYKVSIGFSIASIVLGVILTVAAIAYVFYFYYVIFS